MNLTEKQQAILVGTLLGDAYLQKTGSKNARLRFEHGVDQKEYLFWKTDQFPKLFSSKPVFVERIHPKTKKQYSYWRSQSSASPTLGKWRELFYLDGKKYIPQILSRLLVSPVGLAVWYMDDGYYSLRDKNSYIYLGRVTNNEARIAQATLLKNYGLRVTIYDKKKKGYALFFPVQETEKLHDLIRVHVHPLFNYKLQTQTSP